MKKTLINLGLTAGAVYVLYRLFKKYDVIPMNKPLPVDGASGFDGSPQELLNPSRKPKYQEYLNEKDATGEVKSYNKLTIVSPGKPVRPINRPQRSSINKTGLNFSGSDLTFNGAGDF